MLDLSFMISPLSYSGQSGYAVFYRAYSPDLQHPLYICHAALPSAARAVHDKEHHIRQEYADHAAEHDAFDVPAEQIGHCDRNRRHKEIIELLLVEFPDVLMLEIILEQDIIAHQVIAEEDSEDNSEQSDNSTSLSN